MRKPALFIGLWLLLFATAPIWGLGTRLVGGVPAWAWGSIGLTVVYAFTVHRALGRYWDMSAGDETQRDDG